MAQRTDQRKQTRPELEVYTKALKLSDHILSVCKPKEKNVNTKHIPKRNIGIARLMMEAAIELGADILEANEIYVSSQQDKENRIENYEERIQLQNHAKRLTYRIEHIYRILNADRPFADSTNSYMMDLICETRNLLIGWKESDVRALKKILKE